MNIEEQYLFFINSLTKLGRVWEKGKKEDDNKNHLISKYNLIKNIPRGYEPIRGIGFEFIEERYVEVNYEHRETEPDYRKEWEKKYC